MAHDTHLTRAARACSAAAVCAVILCGAAPMAYGAPGDVAPQEIEKSVPPRPFGPSGDPVVDARAADLGRKLRCPVCQGMPIAESPATMAVDMMQQVRKMLAAGRTDAEVVEYFTSRYGQWVLLEPPHEGFAAWVWILPPLSCALLLLFAGRILWRLRAGETQSTGARTELAGAARSAGNVAHLHAVGSTDAALLDAIRKEVDDS